MGARVDMHRGEASDDFHNGHWESWYGEMEYYKALMRASFGDLSTNSAGNSMEQIVGISFAVATEEFYLEESGTLLVFPPDRRDLWRDLWPLWQQIGVRATVNRLNPRSNP